jgi:hypothetical protein
MHIYFAVVCKREVVMKENKATSEEPRVSGADGTYRKLYECAEDDFRYIAAG